MKSTKKLTVEVIYEQLQAVHTKLITTKTPIRAYNLVTNANKGTKGYLSAVMLNILIKNKILLKIGNGQGYKWNSKIPCTYKLAESVYKLYSEYREANSFKKKIEDRPIINQKPIVKENKVKVGLIRKIINWLW